MLWNPENVGGLNVWECIKSCFMNRVRPVIKHDPSFETIFCSLVFKQLLACIINAFWLVLHGKNEACNKHASHSTKLLRIIIILCDLEFINCCCNANRRLFAVCFCFAFSTVVSAALTATSSLWCLAGCPCRASSFWPCQQWLMGAQATQYKTGFTWKLMAHKWISWL